MGVLQCGEMPALCWTVSNKDSFPHLFFWVLGPHPAVLRVLSFSLQDLVSPMGCQGSNINGLPPCGLHPALSLPPSCAWVLADPVGAPLGLDWAGQFLGLFQPSQFLPLVSPGCRGYRGSSQSRVSRRACLLG